MQNQVPGGWGEFTCDITPEAIEVFNEALQSFVGVSYTPVAFAKQIVNGTNYRFFCNAKAASPNAPNQAAMVDIYKPLDGSAHITDIREI